MRRQLRATTLLVAGLACGAAQAAQGDCLERARDININPDANASALNLDVDTRTTSAPG